MACFILAELGQRKGMLQGQMTILLSYNYRGRVEEKEPFVVNSWLTCYKAEFKLFDREKSRGIWR